MSLQELGLRVRRASRAMAGASGAVRDDVLRHAVAWNGARNWKTIAGLLKNRTDVQCLHRWQKVLKPGLVKGPWTEEVRRRRGDGSAGGGGGVAEGITHTVRWGRHRCST